MGRIRRGFAVATMVGSAMAFAAPTAGAADEVRINHWGVGAIGTFDVCDELGGGELFCQDRFVTYAAGGERGDRSGPDLYYEHYAAYIHPDGGVDEVIAETGFLGNAPGQIDRSRLTFASAAGATMNLYDIDPETGELTPNGRTVTLGPFAWTAASEPYVFGNDGPFGFGLPRHYVDHCVTEIENAHERFTTAHVTGTIDGVSVANYGPGYLPWPGTGPADAFGAIFDNRFMVGVVSHSPTCGTG